MKKPLEVALVVLGLAAALFVCGGSALALWGFSGFRGEVCLHLGELPGLVARTGRLTHCTQLAVDGGHSVFAVKGARGHGQAFVTSHTDPHGNVTVEAVQLATDGGLFDIE